MSTTPATDFNNVATNNNASPADETIVVQNQQPPSHYRAHAATTYTSLISDSIPPLNVLPPIDQDTMTIPLQHQQQPMAATKSGWTTPTKNVGGNNTVILGNNAGEKATPPRGSFCIMIPCSNSHPFEERRIQVTHSEENAIKIGRSVVRLQPSTNNAIFDCKVLSRNHAILWQNNEGQFLIKDTRSSNGTFINNERLSASGEESEPRELYSGDILQLGVEIVDNTKKVASGCVTCIIRLVNERGEEFASRPQGDPFSQLQIRNEQQIPTNYTLVRNDKIFVLEQYIKEAKFRENLLGQKLQTLEEQLIGSQEALQTRWDEHINQELLLSRIEFLESQLGFFTNHKKTSSSNAPQMTEANDGEKERLKKEMQELMEDRAKAEQIAKETIRTKMEQMQETSMRLHDAEMSLVNLEEECAFLKQKCSDYEEKKREEYETLLAKYNEVCAQLSALEKANTLAPPPETTAAIDGEAAIDGQLNENKEETTNVLNNHQNKAESTEIETNPSNNSPNAEIKWIEVPTTTQTGLTPLENATSSSEQQFNQIQHECQEELLKHLAAETQRELNRQLESYNLLMEKYKQKEEQLELLQTLTRENNMVSRDGHGIHDNANATVAPGHSSTDFQVFLLSTSPFLLILMLLFSPFFYFFGFPSTIFPNETADRTSSAANNDGNLVELPDETRNEEETN